MPYKMPKFFPLHLTVLFIIGLFWVILSYLMCSMLCFIWCIPHVMWYVFIVMYFWLFVIGNLLFVISYISCGPSFMLCIMCYMLYIMCYILRAFKYYVSTFWGVGGLSQNADTADTGERGLGVSDKMLILLMLGSAGVEKSGLRA